MTALTAAIAEFAATRLDVGEFAAADLSLAMGDCSRRLYVSIREIISEHSDNVAAEERQLLQWLQTAGRNDTATDYVFGRETLPGGGPI